MSINEYFYIHLQIANPVHEDGVAFQAAGLSYATKFDLRKLQDLPCTDEWLEVPPAPQFGAIPKLGVLHASLYRRAKTAFEPGS